MDTRRRSKELTEEELYTGLMELVICKENISRITQLLKDKPQSAGFPVVDNLAEALEVQRLQREKQDWEERANNTCYELVVDGAPLDCHYKVKMHYTAPDGEVIARSPKVRLYKKDKQALHSVVL